MEHDRAILGIERIDDAAPSRRAREGAEARSPAVINPKHLESGLVLCGECRGSPNQYEIDFEECCPCCHGEGSVADPDFIDGDAREFDPHREFGTHGRYRGHF